VEVAPRGTETRDSRIKESDSRFGFPIWDEAVLARGSGNCVIAALAGDADSLNRQRRSVKGLLARPEPTGTGAQSSIAK
jgi:hypothetical protein